MPHRVELFTGLTTEDSVAIAQWDEYTITLDMLAPGSPFTFTIWHSAETRSAWRYLRRKVKAGDSALVFLDSVTMLNGRITGLDTGGGHDGVTTTVSGRAMASVPMTWDADPTVVVRNLTLDDALGRIFAGLGQPVRMSVDAAQVREVQTRAIRYTRGGRKRKPRRTVVDQSHARPGETVWSYASNLARKAGFLLWEAPDPDAGLAVVVDKPAFESDVLFRFERVAVGDNPATGASNYEGNVLNGHEVFDFANVPTTVTVYTGTSRGDTVSTRGRAVVTNAALTDVAVTRGFVLDPPPAQPRHVRSDRARTIERAEQEARRTIADAMRGFRTYTCTVQGHGMSVDGAPRLFAPNTMARVYDDVCVSAEGEALNEDMLITRVTFRGGRRNGVGQVTDLTLVPKGSIVLEPTP